VRAALLIALPSGLVVSGVVRWAVRLANALAQRGRETGLVVHAPVPGAASVACDIDPRVRITDLTHLPPLRAGRSTREYLPAYRRAAEELRGGTVVISPNLLAECYALACEVASEAPACRSLVGWLHIDLPYEYHVQRVFERFIRRFVCVSARIESRLRDVLPHRSNDIVRVGYGVPAASKVFERPVPESRPLKIVYAGRLDAWQKRVLALGAMSDALRRRGIGHELVVVGDGPCAGALRRRCAGQREIRILGPAGDAEVGGLLRAADVLVLPSRFEGMPLAVLEALACGCVPVIARGADPEGEAVRHNENGIVVDIDDLGGDEEAGERLAGGIALARGGLSRLSRAALASGMRWSMARHADAVEQMLDAMGREMETPTCDGACVPGEIVPACGADGVHAGVSRAADLVSVPPDACERMERVLGSLGGGRVIIHGAGRHTHAVLGVLERRNDMIAGIADDDPAMWGRAVGSFRVTSPAQAARSGATDVVISSWLNESVIWLRRAIYERAGLRVHRLYGAEPVIAASAR
jgi:glycosyltransferase involved in cell wall biosynthesis